MPGILPRKQRIEITYDRGHVERYDCGHFFARSRFSKVSIVENEGVMKTNEEGKIQVIPMALSEK